MATAVLDNLKRGYHRSWWALLLRALVSIAVGVFILARPLESVAAFALVIAYWALFSGFVNIVHAFDVKPILKHWWVMLLSGVVSVGFGIAALLYYPVLSLTFAVVWAAWWLMITGVLAIYGAFMERNLGQPWGWTAVFGVFSVIASAYALLAPPLTLLAIMALIAWFAIVSGVALLIGAFKLRSVVPF